MCLNQNVHATIDKNKKRYLYKLVYSGYDYIQIFRLDNNIGLLGYVTNKGYVNQCYYEEKYPIPEYIIEECKQHFKIVH